MLTHLDEPLFDGAGATKRDLVDYLEAVAPLMLPELRGRPLSVIRVRAGQRPFMQKNLPDYAPPWIRSVTMWAESSRREVRYPLCDDWRTLLWLANQRAVEYHATLGPAGHLDRPSYLVLDIDPPPGGPFGQAVAAARLVRQALTGVGLSGAVKTSGAKGLHVYVPVDASSEEAAAVTRAVAARAERLDPALATTAFIKDDREGKVFLDSTRAFGATVAAAYSPRVRPGVPVSFPLRWDHLDGVVPGDFTVHTAPGLVAGDDAWAGQLPAPQALDAALVEEGHAIPVARVQAMHEGKRRARARRNPLAGAPPFAELRPGRRRTGQLAAVGVYGPVMGLSAMLGPIASGGLISADVFGTGWRMIFAVNVPVGLAALVLGARLLPAGAKPAGAGSGGARRGRLDPPGALLAGAAMFLLVFPLAQGHSLGWPAWLCGMLAGSVLALAGFGWYQIRRQRAGRDPLVEPSLFRRGPYRAGIVFSIVFTGSLGGIVMIFNVWASHRGGRAAGDRRGAAHRGRRRLHRGPAGPDGDRRDRDGHGVRAAVRHRDGGRPAAGDGLGLRRPADGELARHVARHRRDLLRPGRPPRRPRAGLPQRRGVDRARHCGLLACSFAMAFALPRRAREHG